MGKAVPGCGCAGYSRAHLIRSAAATAGQGLPSIEAGMPIPAGTGLTRRSFVSRAAGLALAVYGARKLGFGAFEEGIAAAAGRPAEPVLVSAFLDGGAGSLSVLAPTGHPRYAQLRPTLALPSDQGTAFSEDTSLRWHPAAGGLSTLHGEGKVSVLPAVGYTDPNQSHFTSRHYWEVGQLDPFARMGWLGRYLDAHGANDNPLQGLALGWDLSPSLASASVPVATLSRPQDYDFSTRDVWDPIEPAMLDAFGALGGLSTGDTGLRSARDATAASGRLREQMEPFQSGYATPGGVNYPADDEFAGRLGALAAMLAAGLPLRAVAVSASGGYDTYSDQAADLPQNLQITCDSLLAFQRDL